MSHLGAAFVALVAIWALVYCVINAVAVRRAQRTPSPPINSDTRTMPPCSYVLMRPCTGSDSYLEAALCSTAKARGIEHARVVFTADSEADPAWPIVVRCADQLRAQGVRVEAVVANTRAFNRKVGQLAYVAQRARETAFVCVDADVDLTDFDLNELLQPLADRSANLAAVWAPPVEVCRPQTWGDRASAAVLGASLHAFSLLGQIDPNGLVGKTFAVRRDALESTGGFAGLVRHLGEDMELAKRLHMHGWRTRMHTHGVFSIASGRALSAALGRYTRWLWVIRAQRPALLASYPLVIAAAPLLLGASLLVSSYAPGWAALLAAAVTWTRVRVARAAARPRQPHSLRAQLFEWLIADVVLLIVFVRALGRARVSWRDRVLLLNPDGQLSTAS